MANLGPTSDKKKMQAIGFGVIGIILVIAGIAVATIHSSLRGSGLGTILLVLGVVLLLIAAYRYTQKSA
jgi:uncharacterized membrane protein